ncbi:MAG TPA: glycoside hydrolase family 15 protein [Acidobacteriota bacterium]|nr:glycoside hydrolase family 15 protein [Acidobacteriota bacterium]
MKLKVTWMSLCAVIAQSLFVFPAFAATQAAKGQPGVTSSWTTGNKTGLGTSLSVRSKVWFTLADGQLTEVYYPRLDVANLRNLDFIITDTKGYRRLESLHAVRRETTWTDKNSLSFTQITSDGARWELTKTYTTDPNRNTLLVQVNFRPLEKNDKRPYQIYALIDPSISNSGLKDTGYTEAKALVASEGNIAMATVARPAFSMTSSGFAGVSDGWTDLTEDGRLDALETRAANGNVVQIGQLAGYDSTLAFGFGESAQSALDEARGSLKDGFAAVKKAYADEWASLVKKLPATSPEFRDTFTMASMTLYALEDKTFRGASIASLSIPWGEVANADDPNIGGYHLVWSRDLYQVATAFLALGDKEAANRALDYLFEKQQRPDGSFPQNSWLDGRPFWTSIQMDEAAFPLILAWQLERFDENTYRQHIRPSAEFIVKTGPETQQERWEEESGYSPSTIAAEIAGLICAADIARKLKKNDDADRYVKKANEWATGVETWCYTTTGPHDAGERERGYYFRINDDKDPNDGAKIEINNGGGTYDERSIIDGGFLELVRLGIRPGTDPKITRSVAVMDKTIRVDTPKGPGWYRYNHDGYGDRLDGSGWTGQGIGRLWPLLTGERGELALANGEDATLYARTMMGFASSTHMIGEQVWDRNWPPDARWKMAHNTGAATPLAWCMAQFIRLVLGIQQKRIIEQPTVVRDHFQNQR